MECYQQTLTDLNSAIAQNTDNAKALAQQGESYRLMGDFEAALAYFNRAVELNFNYAWAIAHRGEIYHQMKRYEEARTDFSRAIDLNPNYTWAIAHRGVTYRFRGKPYYDKALADLTRAIELNPDYAWAIAYRCQIYGLMNSYENALVDFDQAIALDKTIIPNWPGERGLLLSYLGRYAEVIECCKQGLQDNPDDYITLYTLAVIETRRKGLAEAKTTIDKTRAALQATIKTKACAGILYRLGGLAALEGNFEQALSFLQEAILLDNEPLELARRDLAWLDLCDHSDFQVLINSTIY
ncbi:MAG: tetratricopeptide repeat protein [Nostoc sp.]|uniref:tetratricopeptide repeat protein n=1 Tax=Nostoc sp. TaxID=1180 RepID=UPI002FF161C5